MDSVDNATDYWAGFTTRTPDGEAPSLRLQHSPRSHDRADAAIRRVLQDPAVQDAMAGIRNNVGAPEPPPGHRDPAGTAWGEGPPETDPGRPGGIRILGVADFGPAATTEELMAAARRSDDEIAAWAERDTEWGRKLRSRCRAFARENRNPHASPPIVAWVMERTLGDHWSRSEEEMVRILATEYAGPAPTAYVNPLPDQDLRVVVRPGRILVDLTHATQEDLLDLVKPLAQLRAALGYYNDPGGRKRGGTNWTREDFLYELPRARQKLRAMKHRTPTATELADEMGISDSTFYRYKRNWLPSNTSW